MSYSTPWPLALALLTFALLLLPACSRDVPSPEPGSEVEAESLAAQFGEPVALQIKAKGDVPAFTVALATSRGAAVDSVVEPLTAVLFQAVGACPDFIKDASLGRDTVITFRIDDGTARATPGDDATTSEKCLLGKIEGASVRTPPGMRFEAMARFIFDTATRAGSGT